MLLQAGHTQEGKAEPQWLAANLALKGFVSLAFDPAGQGEREQTYDPQIKAPAAGWSVNEHIHAGAQASLVGKVVTRYFIWDAKRSIDYLVSRPEVDPAANRRRRLFGWRRVDDIHRSPGLTAQSGDPRLFSQFVPALVHGSRSPFRNDSSAASRHRAGYGGFRGVIRSHAVADPGDRAGLFHAARGQNVYEEARRWYSLYGAEDKIAFFVGPGPHGTPLVSREAVYQWLIRWLNDGRGDFHEQPVKLYTNHELLVTRTGRVEDEPGSRKLYQLILDSLQAKKSRARGRSWAELRSLEIPTDGSAPASEDAGGNGR